MGALLETDRLTKVYRDFWGRRRHPALRELSIAVPEGSIYGLLGPNGSGKTTTIKLSLGLLFPTAGTVRLLGKDPADPAARERVGFLPEENYVYGHLTGLEAVAFYGALFGLGRAERGRRAAALLERTGLEREAWRRPVREYSKGMARRVGLAQALVGDPRLLILDEPTSGLDPQGAVELKRLLQELRNQGTTILLSTHLLAEMESICDRVAVIHHGRLLCEGTLPELLARRDRVRLTVRGLDGEGLEGLKAEARARGGEVVEAGPPLESLEEFFLRTISEPPAGSGGGS